MSGMTRRAFVGSVAGGLGVAASHFEWIAYAQDDERLERIGADARRLAQAIQEQDGLNEDLLFEVLQNLRLHADLRTPAQDFQVRFAIESNIEQQGYDSFLAAVGGLAANPPTAMMQELEGMSSDILRLSESPGAVVDSLRQASFAASVPRDISGYLRNFADRLESLAVDVSEDRCSQAMDAYDELSTAVLAICVASILSINPGLGTLCAALTLQTAMAFGALCYFCECP